MLGEGDVEADLRARREDLKEITIQVREIQRSLAKELKQNKFWKAQRERELSFLGASSKGGTRGEVPMLAQRQHKENLTPSKAEGPRATPSPSPARAKTGRKKTTPAGQQLVLREQNEGALTERAEGGVQLRAAKEEGRYEESLRLLNERLSNEIETHMETHESLESLRDELEDSKGREREANKRVETLLSEMKAARAQQHHRESEFGINLMKHQTFLQEERMQRFQVEKDLHRVLRQNQSLQKTLKKLTCVAQEKEDKLACLSKELEESKGSPAAGVAMMGARAEGPGHEELGQAPATDSGSSVQEELLQHLREQLEEAAETAQIHQEDAEAKEMHCTFLQEQLSLAESSIVDKEREVEERCSAKLKDLEATSLNFMQVNEDLINELEGKEDELNRKNAEIEGLEQELMQKDGIINLLRETIEGMK
ncbi:hypothetical protein HOP50_06g43460 [Chloropicon primus]|uniref:Uncharacterized protein n=2 Tax=Chloropicon primus TaxID=1764295 RepID=A0A5B8MQC2_9CHLO|nr:hypothetical protein A3770_06p43230 [Chloropicon primus]UPR01025.1 hypothetical protein HOP50_06g43460 [Chloropicon primus]|eukprot:QDZ21805.1 hypothetical protein A3770_06p43230 [Chloropicon primus]